MLEIYRVALVTKYLQRKNVLAKKKKFVHPARGINDLMLLVSASLSATGWVSSGT